MTPTLNNLLKTGVTLVLAALWSSVAAQSYETAPTPPSPMNLFERTRTDKSNAAIEMALRVFCGQAHCLLGWGHLPASGPDQWDEKWWLIKTNGVTQFIFTATHFRDITYVSAPISRDCSNSVWPRTHASQLIDALKRAGIPAKPADEKCIEPSTNPKQVSDEIGR